MRRCRPGAGLWWIHSSVVVSCLWCLFRKHVALTLSLSNTHLSHPPPALAPARSLSARTRIRHPALTKALVLAAVPEGYRVFEAPEARRTDPWASPAGHKSRDLATRLTMSVRRGHLPPGALPKPYTLMSPSAVGCVADENLWYVDGRHHGGIAATRHASKACTVLAPDLL